MNGTKKRKKERSSSATDGLKFSFVFQ